MTNPDEEERIGVAVGTGPVDAVFRSIDQVIGRPTTLIEYAVHSITEGIDALGNVTVRIVDVDGPDQIISGHGADVDIIVASAKAYIAAKNRMIARVGRRPCGGHRDRRHRLRAGSPSAWAATGSRHRATS